MKDCSPCPIFKECLSAINERESLLKASQGRLRGAHALIQRAMLTGDYTEFDNIDEDDELLLATYEYDDGKYDAASIEEALQSVGDHNPKLQLRFGDYLDNLQAAILDIDFTLFTVQEACTGPQEKTFRNRLKKVIVTACSATPDILDAQPQSFINREHADEYSLITSNRALRLETKALIADSTALLCSIPAMASASTTAMIYALDAPIGPSINVPIWIYETEGIIFGVSLIGVVAFAGLGRVLHGVAKSFDKKSGWNNLG